jgi:hypothetical protein
MRVGDLDEAIRILEGRLGIVDRAGPDDHDEAVVLAAQDRLDVAAPLGHDVSALLPEGELLDQDGGGEERPKLPDPKVVGAIDHRGPP